MVDYAEDHIEGADVNIDIWEKIAFFAQTEEQQKDFMLTDQIREEIAEEEGTEGGDDYREEQKERDGRLLDGDFNPYAEEMKEKDSDLYHTDAAMNPGDADDDKQEEVREPKIVEEDEDRITA